MKAESASLVPAHPRWALALVLAVFAAGLLLIMPSFHGYFFGDEHFYTDSAIRMNQTGQFLAPTFSNGDLRFNKPVLSYWMVLGSFRLFGISVLSSRLASLLAGLFILLLTRRLALRLFKSEAAGWLAMLILASNITLMTASMRATPDIFLCLFSLLSLYGFAGLLLDEPRPADAWLAYIGVGLAVASKGLLGVLLLAFVFAFALARRDRAFRLRALLRPLPILVCLVLALSWFVAVYLKYGMLALDGFFQDQVGSRASASVATGLNNLFKYSFGLAVPFFPWSPLLLAALVAARPLLAATWRQHASAITFALAWYAVLLIVFSAANWTRTRYMLPAFPFLAAVLSALLLAALDHPAVSRLAHRLLQAFIVFLLPLAGAFLFLALTLEKIRLGLAAAVLLLLGALITVALLRAAPRVRPTLLALATFVIIWDIHYLVRPAFPSTPGYALVRALARAGCWRVYYPVQTADMTRLKTGYYKEKYASQVRLISRGTITVERLELPAYLKKTRKLPIICVEEDLALFPPERFKAVRAGAVNREDATISDFWKVLRAPKPRAAFRSLLVPYYIMIPLTPQAPERKPAS